MGDYSWVHDIGAVNLDELSNLYRIAPLGDKPPAALATVFGNSMFTCFAYAGDILAGAGRVLADGLDCAYIADVAVHPGHQGRRLGTHVRDTGSGESTTGRGSQGVAWSSPAGPGVASRSALGRPVRAGPR